MIPFKVDENLPQDAVSLLRLHGHDAMSVSEQQLSGAADEKVLAVCSTEGRVLVTLDLDFADLRAIHTQSTAGIMVLRLARQDKSSVLQALTRILPLLVTDFPAGSLWIVEETRVRIRE